MFKVEPFLPRPNDEPPLEGPFEEAPQLTGIAVRLDFASALATLRSLDGLFLLSSASLSSSFEHHPALLRRPRAVRSGAHGAGVSRCSPPRSCLFRRRFCRFRRRRHFIVVFVVDVARLHTSISAHQARILRVNEMPAAMFSVDLP